MNEPAAEQGAVALNGNTLSLDHNYYTVWFDRNCIVDSGTKKTYRYLESVARALRYSRYDRFYNLDEANERLSILNSAGVPHGIYAVLKVWNVQFTGAK